MKHSWIWLLAFATVGCGTGAKEAEYAPRPVLGPVDDPGRAEAGGASVEIERATSAIGAGDFATAKALLQEAVRKEPSNGTAAYYLGVTLENLGDMAGAEHRYKEAIRLAPDLAEAAVNLGALYIDAGRFDEAVVVTKAGLKRRANESALLANLAMALQGQGKTEEALAAYAKAVKGGEDNAALRWQYANLLLEAGKKAQAADELKLALEKAGDDRALLASIGRALGAAGAFSDCVKALDRAIVAGDAAELRIGRGLCRHSLDDESAAKADFEAAVKLAPESAPAHYYLGRSLLSLGKRDVGIRSLEKAAQLAPETPLAKKAREEAAAARKKK